jgi:hypothetical protein
MNGQRAPSRTAPTARRSTSKRCANTSAIAHPVPSRPRAEHGTGRAASAKANTPATGPPPAPDGRRPSARWPATTTRPTSRPSARRATTHPRPLPAPHRDRPAANRRGEDRRRKRFHDKFLLARSARNAGRLGSLSRALRDRRRRRRDVRSSGMRGVETRRSRGWGCGVEPSRVNAFGVVRGQRTAGAMRAVSPGLDAPDGRVAVAGPGCASAMGLSARSSLGSVAGSRRGT